MEINKQLFLVQSEKYDRKKIKVQSNIEDGIIDKIFEKIEKNSNEFNFCTKDKTFIPDIVGFLIFKDIEIDVLIFPKNFKKIRYDELNTDVFLTIFSMIKKYLENKKILNNFFDEIFKTYFYSKKMISREIVEKDKMYKELTNEILIKFENFFKKHKEEIKFLKHKKSPDYNVQNYLEKLKSKLNLNINSIELKLVKTLIKYLTNEYINSTTKFFVKDNEFDDLWEKTCKLVYGNHLEHRIEDHKSLSLMEGQNKIIDIFNSKNLNLDQILIFDNKEKIFIIDSKFYNKNNKIYSYKELTYARVLEQRLMNETKIFVLLFVPEISDKMKMKEYFFVDWYIHKNFNNEGCCDQTLIAWMVKVGMIKVFEYYLENENEEIINISDFKPDN